MKVIFEDAAINLHRMPTWQYNAVTRLRRAIEVLTQEPYPDHARALEYIDEAVSAVWNEHEGSPREEDI